MSLEITTDNKEDGDVPMHTVTERLALTEDDRLVPEGHPDARWLYAIPGTEITLADAEKYGLAEKAKKQGKKESK